MQLVIELCTPSECELECIQACRQIHGDDAPLQFPKNEQYPLIDKNRCTNCMRCLRECPKDAIRKNETKMKSAKQSQRSLPIRREKPYEVSKDFERFPESKIIFARVHNDSEFDNYGKNEWTGAEGMMKKGIDGYGVFEHKLAVSGWALYSSRNKIHSPQIAVSETTESRMKISSDPNALTDMLKQAARFFGASLVGIAEIDQRWIYKINRQRESYDIPESIQYAVVMAVEMNYDGIATSPAWTSSATTALGYSQMAFLEIQLSDFIKNLGYNALPCGNDIALSVPLAIDAGLGQYGRHGLLITKEYGPRIRLAKVLTDVPLIPDKPDFAFCKSVIRFCEVCEKCAQTCPSQSIPFGKERSWDGETKSNNPGIKKWYINPETCYNFWIENGSECSNCIRSCPYNKPNNFLHKMVLWIVQHMPWMNRLILKMDDVVGYGKQKNPLKYLQKFR